MKITNIPTGGLCNRLRSIATAIAVAKSYNCPITIQWNNCNGLRADFKDLFYPINEKDVNLIENKKWIYKITGTKDYMLKSIFLKAMFEKTIFNYSIYNQGEIYNVLKKNYKRNLLLVSCYPMCKTYTIKDMFKPQKDIQKRIDLVTSQFSDYTVGVHIRRTDNKVSINSSPLDVFIKRMNQEIVNNRTTIFYLASDDATVKEDLIKRFPNKIVTLKDDTSRESLEGMKFAVVDLFCLSKTNKIIGSKGSSYSQIAAEIGGINIQYAE